MHKSDNTYTAEGLQKLIIDMFSTWNSTCFEVVDKLWCQIDQNL